MSKPESPSQAPDFKPNPDGLSNLEWDGSMSLELAPDDDELADTGEGGMTEEEAVAFLSRPVAQLGRKGGRA